MFKFVEIKISLNFDKKEIALTHAVLFSLVQTKALDKR